MHGKCACDVLILVDHKLKGAIIVVLEILQPIVEVIPETLVWLHQLVVNSTASLDYLLFFRINLLCSC
jgi:hypothetical protein